MSSLFSNPFLDTHAYIYFNIHIFLTKSNLFFSTWMTYVCIIVVSGSQDWDYVAVKRWLLHWDTGPVVRRLCKYPFIYFFPISDWSIVQEFPGLLIQQKVYCHPTTESNSHNMRLLLIKLHLIRVHLWLPSKIKRTKNKWLKSTSIKYEITIKSG